MRAERKRLGLSQTDLAEVGGVRKQAQMHYETGLRSPQAEYLQRIAACGVNTSYVLTGQVSTADLATVEAQLVSSFRAASADTRRAILRILEIADPMPETTSETAQPEEAAKIRMGDNHGQVFTGPMTQSGVTFNVGSGGRQRRKPSR